MKGTCLYEWNLLTIICCLVWIISYSLEEQLFNDLFTLSIYIYINFKYVYTHFDFSMLKLSNNKLKMKKLSSK